MKKWASRWKRFKRLKPSEWAERFRILPSGINAEPGPWRNARTPYLVGIMDATAEAGNEMVVVLKPTQVGFSEMQRNLLGYWIDRDPGPTMLVMPSQQSAEEAMEERIRPLLNETPAVRKHLSDRREDNKLSTTRLDTMSLHIGWAGSPQALASRPIRYLLPDEVDKYPAFAGRESDPISLALKRLSTFGHRARVVAGSTPTTRRGNVWRLWESCTDRRRYFVPCPHCSHMQALSWSSVQYPQRADDVERSAHAEKVEAESLAWYECESCKVRIEDHHKPRMLIRGEWRSETPGAANRRIGFHLNSLYSPWLTFSKLAGEFIRAVDDPALMMDFRNSRLAEPFEERASATDVSIIRKKIPLSGPPMMVPKWAMLLLGTIDTQSDHLWFTIRAWGAGRRSALIRYGPALSLDECRQIMFDNPGLYVEGGEAVAVQICGIDARGFGGKRRDEVYTFAQSDPRIWPMVGAASPQAAPVTRKIVAGYQILNYTTNPNHWKDVLHGLIHDADPTKWLPHTTVGDDYLRQLASEHKVFDPHTGSWGWEPVTKNAPNHLWDCEYMQCCIAELNGVAGLTTEPPPPPPPRDKPPENPVDYRGRW